MPAVRRSSRQAGKNQDVKSEIASSPKSTKRAASHAEDEDLAVKYKENGGSSTGSSAMTGKAASLARQMTGGSLRTRLVPMTKFPYDVPYKQLDVRQEPYLYRPARGEQGVLMVEPYKSELLPHWKFKQPSDAETSSKALRDMFETYLEQDDFIGADMARKFIQMGFTRSRRYANHAGGRKYVVPASQLQSTEPKTKREQIPRLSVEDPIKAESARIFMRVLEGVNANERYVALREKFEQEHKDVPIPVFEQDAEKKATKKR